MAVYLCLCGVIMVVDNPTTCTTVSVGSGMRTLVYALGVKSFVASSNTPLVFGFRSLWIDKDVWLRLYPVSTWGALKTLLLMLFDL